MLPRIDKGEEKMSKDNEVNGIEQVIEDLKGWTARIEGLLDSLTGIGSERYCTNEMIAIEMELDTVIRTSTL